jgi:hypothetical protein
LVQVAWDKKIQRIIQNFIYNIQKRTLAPKEIQQNAKKGAQSRIWVSAKQKAPNTHIDSSTGSVSAPIQVHFQHPYRFTRLFDQDLQFEFQQNKKLPTPIQIAVHVHFQQASVFITVAEYFIL